MVDDNKVSEDNNHNAPAAEGLEQLDAPEKPHVDEKAEKGDGRKKGLQKEIERLKEQQAQLQTELDAQRDRYLRLAAELDNYRKRNERDFNARVQMLLSEFYVELLPIVDDLERSVETLRSSGAHDKNTDPDSLIDGLELILQNFRKLLESRGVKALDAVGTPFDPTKHEALTQIDGNGEKPHTVLEEHVKGYMLFDRILRPAKVVISK